MPSPLPLARTVALESPTRLRMRPKACAETEGGLQTRAVAGPESTQKLSESVMASIGGPERQLFDRVQPIADPLQGTERFQEPRTEHPPGHCCHGAIDFVEERALEAPFGPSHNLEVPERDRVDDQAIG